MPVAVIRGQQGSSLVMVLVATLLVGGLSLFVAEIFRQQSKVQKALAQKYEMMDAKNTIMSLFSNSTTCGCNLKKGLSVGHPSYPYIDSTKPDNPLSGADESTPISFSDIKAGCNVDSPVVLSTSTTGIGSSAFGLKIESIELKNFAPITLPVADSLDWKAKWVVTYKSSSMEMDSQPVVVTQLVKVYSTTENPDSTPEHRLIKSCIGNGSKTIYNSGSAQLSCYDIRVDGVQASPDNQIGSLHYGCTGEGNGGLGTTDPDAYLMSFSCTGTPGLLENRTGIAGVACIKPDSASTFSAVTNRALKMLCCKFTTDE